MKLTRPAALLGTVLLVSSAIAQTPAPVAVPRQEPRFDITRFVVEGATLLTEDEIESAVGPFRGKARDFADVQRALEAMERAYSTKGYNAVQVMLPEQEVERGEVRFRVIEAKVGAIVVEGNKFFDEENILASLPALAPGGAPNIHSIADNVRVANESPAKQTTVLLRGGAGEGVVDAVVRVADERPTKYSVTLDDTGTPQTGKYRFGIGFQHANLWNRDHVLSMQYVTAPNQPDHPDSLTVVPNKNVLIAGASYHVPVYRWGDSIDISAGYSNVNSGVVQNLFNVSGAGTIFGFKYNHALPRWGDVEHRLAFGFDWRAFRNNVSQVGTGIALIPDVTVHPISLQYSGAYRQASHETTYSVSYYRNIPGGNDGDSAAFEASRPGAPPAYALLRYAINHNRAFGNDWQFRAAFNGQATRDKLVAGEMFGIGGIDSVRGFLEREVVNDYGYRGTLEGYSPDFAGKMDWLSGFRMRGVVFYDWGRVTRIEPLAAEPYRQGVGSTGFGVRLSRGVNLSLRLDYAFVLDQGGLEKRGDSRVHMTFAYIF